MRDTDVAYTAGFFDGEGSIHLTFDKYIRLEVGVSQKHPMVLLWMRSTFGGNVYQSKEYAPQWKVHGSKAIEFLLLIKPYLMEKAVDAEEAIRIWSVKDDPSLAKELIAARKERRNAS